MASAVAPAKPTMILPWWILRTFLARCFMTISPRVTWPSPATATLSPRRTMRMVVPRNCSLSIKKTSRPAAKNNAEQLG